MTDQPIDSPYSDRRTKRSVMSTPRSSAPVEEARLAERRRGFFDSLDKPMLIVVGVLLTIGLIMVYSTTFDWSLYEYDTTYTVFLKHARNMAIGVVVLAVVMVIDYRIWRRFAVWLLLLAIASLAAVLLFGEVTFGAKRSLIGGSYQPGELAELAIIVYMAAWLGSKRTRIRSITYGLLPFSVLVGIVGGLVLGQPDLSTAAIIFITSGVMFFLAGADLIQLFITVLVAVVISVILMFSGTLLPNYAQDRVTSYWEGIGDLTQANYQTQQAVIAFRNGGWTGVGLGESRQKFGFLPVPHTDSIFAVIGEEMGVMGAAVVVGLYAVFVMRGFQIARRATDAFGALLAAGITIWVVFKALLNIAVMLALVPTTGVSLPFISYGGSSLMVLLIGVGLMLSVQRVTFSRQNTPERRVASATYHSGGRHGRTRVSRAGRSRSDSQTKPQR